MRSAAARPTRIIGEAFYIYAARTPSEFQGLATLECEPGDLPTGVLVGIAGV